MLNLVEYPNVKAIHIMQDNELIFYKFREGTSDTELFPVGYIFKSVLSVLVGIAGRLQ